MPKDRPEQHIGIITATICDQGLASWNDVGSEERPLTTDQPAVLSLLRYAVAPLCLRLTIAFSESPLSRIMLYKDTGAAAKVLQMARGD